MTSVIKKYKSDYTQNTQIINLNFNENNEIINYKIQLIQEILPNGFSTLHSAHCKYKDKRVLNNRFSDYDPNSHSYK